MIGEEEEVRAVHSGDSPASTGSFTGSSVAAGRYAVPSRPR